MVYENREYDKYDKIERYIRGEAKSFLEFLQKIIKNIHKLLKGGN